MRLLAYSVAAMKMKISAVTAITPIGITVENEYSSMTQPPLLLSLIGKVLLSLHYVTIMACRL